MEEGKESNASGSSNVMGFNGGAGCGSFFIRDNNQKYYNMFTSFVQIKRGSSFQSINPENSRALQKLTANDVLAMQFDSCEAGESFYHKYASAIGFVVRDGDIRRNEHGEVVTRRWICNSGEGVNCPAAFCIGQQPVSHKWIVTQFVARHTHHELSPTCKSLLQIDYPKKNSVNVKRKGLANFQAPCRAEIPISDVEAALDFLSAKMDSDDGLFYDTKFVKGQLTSLFWADSQSQVDNACFGDVMAVYRTKSCMMHVVVLAGLNHHHQTCVFGCALLQDETVEAYSWLFQTFLHVMQGCMPISVVTDDHQAMRKAIKLVLPRSRHRLCTWNLEKNAHSIVDDRFFITDFKVCMLDVLSQDDFELKWKRMVEKYDVSENLWIKRIDSERYMWAETYLRGHFWAGLQSTRICERIGKHLSQFSQIKLKLHEFLNECVYAINAHRWEEAKADYESTNVQFSLSNPIVEIEKHAADVFTRESYKKFLSEMQLESSLFVVNKDAGTNHIKYTLGSHENKNLSYEVMVKPSGPSIKCSCLKFETLGLPCCHAIHVIKAEEIEKNPQDLIHPRWTKSAKSSAQFWHRSLPPVSSDLMEKMERYGALSSQISILCYLGSIADEVDYSRLRSNLDELNHEILERHGVSEAAEEVDQHLTG